MDTFSYSVFICPLVLAHCLSCTHLLFLQTQTMEPWAKIIPLTLYTNAGFYFQLFIWTLEMPCDKMKIKILCLIICANNKWQFSIRLQWDLFEKEDLGKALQVYNFNIHTYRDSSSWIWTCERWTHIWPYIFLNQLLTSCRKSKWPLSEWFGAVPLHKFNMEKSYEETLN